MAGFGTYCAEGSRFDSGGRHLMEKNAKWKCIFTILSGAFAKNWAGFGHHSKLNSDTWAIVRFSVVMTGAPFAPEFRLSGDGLFPGNIRSAFAGRGVTAKCYPVRQGGGDLKLLKFGSQPWGGPPTTKKKRILNRRKRIPSGLGGNSPHGAFRYQPVLRGKATSVKR